MGVVPSDLAVAISTRFEVLFLNSYNQTVAVERARIASLLMEIPLGDHQGNKVTLDWLGAAPQMREWADEKRAQGLNKFSWEAVVRRYEASIELDLDAFRDARYNIYEPRIQEMAQNGGRLEYNLLSDLIKNGHMSNCYDGQNFFSTDHSEGASGTQSNLLTGSGTSLSQITEDYFKAYTALLGFRDDQGVPMQPSNFRPTIWIPNHPVLVERFERLRDSALLPAGASTGGDSNILRGRFELVVDPRLTDPNDWYMFRPEGAVKPFILVNREAVHYADNISLANDDVFKRRKAMASAEGRCVMTYGLWQKAVKITNA